MLCVSLIKPITYGSSAGCCQPNKSFANVTTPQCSDSRSTPAQVGFGQARLIDEVIRRLLRIFVRILNGGFESAHDVGAVRGGAVKEVHVMLLGKGELLLCDLHVGLGLVVCHLHLSHVSASVLARVVVNCSSD